MPTARELLEQADALMRRNRAAAVDDIPVLTDSVSPLPQLRSPVRPAAPVARPPPARLTADPIPTLIDSVAPDLAAPAAAIVQEGEPSDWLDLDAGEPSITGDAPDSIAIVPPVEFALRDDAELSDSAEHEEIELTTPAEDDFDAEFGEPEFEEAPPAESTPAVTPAAVTTAA